MSFQRYIPIIVIIIALIGALVLISKGINKNATPAVDDDDHHSQVQVLHNAALHPTA